MATSIPGERYRHYWVVSDESLLVQTICSPTSTGIQSVRGVNGLPANPSCVAAGTRILDRPGFSVNAVSPYNLRGLRVHVNLIPYNSIGEGPGTAAERRRWLPRP